MNVFLSFEIWKVIFLCSVLYCTQRFDEAGIFFSLGGMFGVSLELGGKHDEGRHNFRGDWPVRQNNVNSDHFRDLDWEIWNKDIMGKNNGGEGRHHFKGVHCRAISTTKPAPCQR